MTTAVVARRWSEALDLEVALLEPSDWVAVPISRRRCAARTRNGPVPRSDATSPCAAAFAGPASTPPRSACTPRSSTGRPSATRCSRPVGPATDIAFATAPRTSHRLSRPARTSSAMTVAEGWYRGRLGFRGGQPRRLRRRHRADRPARAVLRRRHRETISTGGQRATVKGGARADWRLSAEPVRRRERRRAPRRAGLGDSRASTTPTGWPCVSWHRLPPRSSPRAARPCVVSRRGVPCPYTARRAARRSSTSARTSRAESGSACVAGAGTRSPCATPRCSRTASWPRGRCATRRRPTATSSRGGEEESYEPELHVPRVPLRRDRRLARRARPRHRRGRRLPHRHGAAPARSMLRTTALNRLHENVVWSMRGNFVDVPTDCPQRDERLGWTGDIQVFAPTATFLVRLRRLARPRGWTTSPPSSAHDGTRPRRTCPDRS